MVTRAWYVELDESIPEFLTNDCGKMSLRAETGALSVDVNATLANEVVN